MAGGKCCIRDERASDGISVQPGGFLTCMFSQCFDPRPSLADVNIMTRYPGAPVQYGVKKWILLYQAY
jgi:hypothetical protein